MEDKSYFTVADVEIIEQKTVFKGFFEVACIRLKHALFAGGTSQEIQREIFLRKAAVGVLLYDPVKDAIVLVEQFRVGALLNADPNQQPWILEVVAGIVDTDETEEQVARRESIEEAGVEPEELLPMMQYMVSPGGSSEIFYLFCGKIDSSNVAGIHGLDDEGEDIRVHVVSVDDALSLLEQGQLNNAATIISLQWLQHKHQWLRQKWS